MYDSNTKTSLDLFNEDKNTAINEKGRVVRVDMFKGYTVEQRRKILQENEEVMRQQR
jgi:DNA-binding transcriptional regulator of glucitol operon